MLVRGTIEMLQMASGSHPKSFNDFTKISIRKKRLSSTTVSKRLKELIAANMLEEVITRSKTGRRVIAYKTTEKGIKVIEHAKIIQDALFSSKAK